MAAKKYFWIRKKGNFGKSTKFNDPMPPLDSDMEKHLLRLGYISTKKHDSFDSADASAFEAVKEVNATLAAENKHFKNANTVLEKDNKELSAENVDLKNQVSDVKGVKESNLTLSDKVAELEAELEDFPKNVKEANKKVKTLEKELAEATKPGGN